MDEEPAITTAAEGEEKKRNRANDTRVQDEVPGVFSVILCLVSLSFFVLPLVSFGLVDSSGVGRRHTTQIIPARDDETRDRSGKSTNTKTDWD